MLFIWYLFVFYVSFIFLKCLFRFQVVFDKPLYRVMVRLYISFFFHIFHIFPFVSEERLHSPVLAFGTTVSRSSDYGKRGGKTSRGSIRVSITRTKRIFDCNSRRFNFWSPEFGASQCNVSPFPLILILSNHILF